VTGHLHVEGELELGY